MMAIFDIEGLSTIFLLTISKLQSLQSDDNIETGVEIFLTK